jgi:hypothetical protein
MAPEMTHDREGASGEADRRGEMPDLAPGAIIDALNGGPTYFNGPNDDAYRILATLRRNVGAKHFDVVMGTGPRLTDQSRAGRTRKSSGLPVGVLGARTTMRV